MSQATPELLRALAGINPKQPYGTELFDALARITVSVAVEAVCIRKTRIHQNTIYGEICLTRRPDDDTAYLGQWHCPGSVMRPGEEVINVIWRLAEKEFGGKIPFWDFITLFNNPIEQRGHFFSVVYLCELSNGESIKGTWFPISGKKNRAQGIEGLPKKTVVHHRSHIIPAALYFAAKWQ